MATAIDLPEEHRHYAKRIPGDLLARLPGDELRLRVKHAAGLDSAANRASDRDLARGLRLIATRALKAMPVREFLEEEKRLIEARNHASSELEVVNGALVSGRFGVEDALSTLRRENPYPPGLVHAANRRLLGEKIPGPEGADLDEILGIPAEKTARKTDVAKAAAVRTAVRKAVDAEMSGRQKVSKEIADLRREIELFKARHTEAAGSRRGR